ncbi:MAG: BrnT family toxin [Candidatus Dormibacteraceae bacterium]
MDDRQVVWDAANRKHLIEDHPDRRISVDEIEQVLADRRQIEVYLEKRDAYEVIGRTGTGRWLVVIWIDQPTGRYPIHVREASRRIIRRISK